MLVGTCITCNRGPCVAVAPDGRCKYCSLAGTPIVEAEDSINLDGALFMMDLSAIQLGTNISRLSSETVQDQDFLDLRRSIQDDGLLEPLLVDQDNKLIAGKRRYLACSQLGMKSVAVRRKHVKDQLDSHMVNLIENLVRANPTAADLAIAFTALLADLKAKGMTNNAALAYLSMRTKRRKVDIQQLVRIREKLIPDLFRAFEGRGGIPLTLAEASEYAGLTEDEQARIFVHWNATGGAGRGDSEEVIGEGPELPKRPTRAETGAMMASIRVTQAGTSGQEYAIGAKDALRWSMGDRAPLETYLKHAAK